MYKMHFDDNEHILHCKVSFGRPPSHSQRLLFVGWSGREMKSLLYYPSTHRCGISLILQQLDSTCLYILLYASHKPPSRDVTSGQEYNKTEHSSLCKVNTKTRQPSIFPVTCSSEGCPKDSDLPTHPLIPLDVVTYLWVN